MLLPGGFDSTHPHYVLGCVKSSNKTFLCISIKQYLMQNINLTASYYAQVAVNMVILFVKKHKLYLF